MSTADKSGFTSAARLFVWDSRLSSPARAFVAFREAICSNFMPWTPEFSGEEFHGRVESISYENGTVGRVRTSAITAAKTKSNIASSVMECVHGNFIIGGELKVEQGGRTTIARPGELALYQSYDPVVLTERPDTPCDNLAFIIPRSELSDETNVDNLFRNVVVNADRLAGPLGSCLNLIAAGLTTFTESQLSSLFDACVALLPLVLTSNLSVGVGKNNRRMREVLRYIDQNLANPNLAPALVAEHLGVSVRYIHKLFAGTPATFGSYVTGQRLERVKWDLLASSKKPPISAIAYRWGFGDLSTFNRAFKSRYQCNPTQFGSRIDPKT